MKSELKEFFGPDVTIVFVDITFGSILTKKYVFFNKIKSCGNKAMKKLKDLFENKKEETKKVKEMVDLLQSHSFKCIGDLKPNDIKFVNQKNLENPQTNEAEIKNFLEKQINKDFDTKSNWSVETNVTYEYLDEKE